MAEITYEKTSDSLASDRSTQFTAIVVTYNEARRLRECLNSLAFCDEVLVVDLGSTDGSADIARQWGAKVICHERVEVVEDIHEKAAGWASHDWLVLLDPDEVLPAGIEHDIRSILLARPKVGVIGVPLQYYFRGKPLVGTVWGGTKYKNLIRHRKRVAFRKAVHRGYTLLPGYERVTLERKSPDYCIHHYWVDSYRQMFEKHWRYIRNEGKARYELGERFSWRRWLLSTLKTLAHNLITHKSYRDGLTGIFLGFFHTWYVSFSLLSLWYYQKRTAKGQAPFHLS